jgi:hypothetical protein
MSSSSTSSSPVICRIPVCLSSSSSSSSSSNNDGGLNDDNRAPPIVVDVHDNLVRNKDRLIPVGKGPLIVHRPCDKCNVKSRKWVDVSCSYCERFLCSKCFPTETDETAGRPVETTMPCCDAQLCHDCILEDRQCSACLKRGCAICVDLQCMAKFCSKWMCDEHAFLCTVCRGYFCLLHMNEQSWDYVGSDCRVSATGLICRHCARDRRSSDHKRRREESQERKRLRGSPDISDTTSEEGRNEAAQRRRQGSVPEDDEDGEEVDEE